MLITGPQTVTLTFTGTSRVSWTASSSQPNITVTPTSGKDSATITVTAIAGTSGIVTITAPDTSNSPQTIPVNVAGAIAVTGWALDSIEVTNVDIWREPVGKEPTASNGLCVHWQRGVRRLCADRRRKSISQFSFPLSCRLGYQLLTNLLPNSGGSPGPGNGTYCMP